ncbi:hypothetical protein SASPL_120200 [Salvia splendens]|uniref:Uncharacterized protein n=1 Tax=Salvia splendens TaxID=180675 RepID=A0A8X8ZV02_SALSN|nr:hypothetical protein SASPL_120200 [Salvia splendens]
MQHRGYRPSATPCIDPSAVHAQDGMQVINPEGGKEDAEEGGRWKDETYVSTTADFSMWNIFERTGILVCCAAQVVSTSEFVMCMHCMGTDTSILSSKERDSYWKLMQNYIGSDITSMVTLPVLIFEPMTMLQKMAELMGYSYLLDQADKCDDPYMRMVSAINPPPPPMIAGHAENEHFTYDVTSKLRTKFLGNSLDVYPVGRTRVTLKRDGVVLDLVPPPTKVNNLIFGRTWVDSSGEMIMTNLTTGDKVVLCFQPYGWFGANRYEVDGYVYNADEEPGKWSESMSYQPCDLEGEPLPGTELKEVWHVADVPPDDKFQFTHFAHKINSFNEIHVYALIGWLLRKVTSPRLVLQRAGLYLFLNPLSGPAS